ncbi:hypothetical protein Ddye_017952 [Dipteronia dyeriana]|uniref:Uncharacterized protein n=1 Tax=Dipteronia dyeriana TaxID=168575 RepID=A0AAD9X1E2_9ROSI|nr:hypothetical protein Ddye_017952 [Dipteronia dyeriana]
MMYGKILQFLVQVTTASVGATTAKNTYIIQMDKTKMAANHCQDDSTQTYQAVINSINEMSLQEDDQKQQAELLYSYETAISGFAAKLSSKQFQSLEKVYGFLSAAPASDMIIGILDTGIWPEHVSFKDTGMPAVPSRWKGVCEKGTKFSKSNCNKKLIGARVFFEGYEADFSGLAKGMARGTSYTSRIAVYKVCWRLGCSNLDIMAAIEKAVQDGVDVLSLSMVSYPLPFYSDLVAIGSFYAIKSGVFVSNSAGSSGPFSSSVRNTAPWKMTLAASYIDRSGIPASKFCLGTLNESLVKGKIVVCHGGNGSRYVKSENVKKAKGVGMILVNPKFQGDELTADPHILPTA